MLIVLFRHLVLARDTEAIIVYINVDIILLQTRKLEGSGDQILVRVLVEIHAASVRMSRRRSNR